MMDRRRFLKHSAWTGAALAAGSLSANEIAPRILPESAIFEPNSSHWAQAQPPANPALKENLEADFAILGGGFTGLSAAYYLRRAVPDKHVVVLEAKACGNGASGRNGAMVLNLTAERYMELSSDPAMDKKIYDLTAENIARLHQLSTDTGIDCELDTKGALQVFNTAEDLAAGMTYVRKARDLGMPFELWTNDQVHDALGTGIYAGALFDPQAGQVHPMKLLAAWKRAAENSGVLVYENTAAVKVKTAEGHTITTSGGYRVKARNLVIATNAYSSKLGFFRNAITPIFQYVGMTAPLSESIMNDLRWKSRMPFNDSPTLVHYLGLTRDNRVHIGGGRADYRFNNGLRTPANAKAAYSALQSDLNRIFPALAKVEFETTWSGIVDMTLNFSPTVGKLGNDLYYAVGFCGHGVNLTSLFGRILADLAAGEEDRWREFPFVNHQPPYVPNEPFRWLAVETLLAWYRVAG